MYHILTQRALRSEMHGRMYKTREVACIKRVSTYHDVTLHVAVVSVGSQHICATQYLPLCVSIRLEHALRDFSDQPHRAPCTTRRTPESSMYTRPEHAPLFNDIPAV